ncbi:D-alanyl carrier protein:peptidoglycan D-alanyltransferase [Arcobacter venerupis]|uniref:D-alanyl carrier protein:peptidoglycan D-alanyltransferase n=1 Tax=Arcobacter venerupis TaxID=1054033 RepID=A0AAE7E394_9BACT|nr:D-alanyl-lipoteichoic acid biosynthesis protein DltD [Arcobacter venerupis]QKF67013.1 D-alanyl carrier protein:peptidoglycan D-alanyltransferase [Arcobacter venerupis]RWS50040.1 DltD [Arcobacter venerupis]
MNKLFTNILSFISASIVVILVIYFGKDIILNYYAKPLQDSLQKTVSLQSDLETGKIVVFGSSELVLYPNQKFLPQNFFNNDLNLPLRVQGNEGQQDFVIMAQLAACDNDIVRQNARVVVLLSPSWFTGSNDNGLIMPKFLEYMYSGMMNKLYFQSETDDKYRNLVSDYIQKNISLIKDPNFIYKFPLDILENDYLDNVIKKNLIEAFDSKDINPQIVTYINPKLDYDSLKIEANSVALSTSNNIYGINNEYYTKYIEPQIRKRNFPFSIVVPPELDKNQEYQDLLTLLDFFKSYKIKPLFIMQNLNPYVFEKNRDEANELMLNIKSKVLEHGFEYLDMWSYKKEDYQIGSMTDIVHMGELGWITVDKKIIDYFMTKKGN